MDLCVFDIIIIIIIIFYSYGSRSNECAYRSDFLKYDFYFFYGHANFCLCTLYFSIHQHLGIFGNSSRSPIWYSMFQHQYKHKCKLPHSRESPHFL
jgi:hypothetical protein